MRIRLENLCHFASKQKVLTIVSLIREYLILISIEASPN